VQIGIIIDFQEHIEIVQQLEEEGEVSENSPNKETTREGLKQQIFRPVRFCKYQKFVDQERRQQDKEIYEKIEEYERVQQDYIPYKEYKGLLQAIYPEHMLTKKQVLQLTLFFIFIIAAVSLIGFVTFVTIKTYDLRISLEKIKDRQAIENSTEFNSTVEAIIPGRFRRAEYRRTDQKEIKIFFRTPEQEKR